MLAVEMSADITHADHRTILDRYATMSGPTYLRGDEQDDGGRRQAPARAGWGSARATSEIGPDRLCRAKAARQRKGTTLLRRAGRGPASLAAIYGQFTIEVQHKRSAQADTSN